MATFHAPRRALRGWRFLREHKAERSMLVDASKATYVFAQRTNENCGAIAGTRSGVDAQTDGALSFFSDGRNVTIWATTDARSRVGART